MSTFPKANGDAQDLYLIDGHAQIFRAYYAIRGGMSSPVTGEPTNATFAFTGMLIKLFLQFSPHYVAMAIDTPGPTFRDELYPDYKAQREAPPDDFGPQVTRILEITRLFGIPILAKDGAEADDLIATVTDRMLADERYEKVKLRLVSKDKDLEQLLGDRVTMFDIHTDTTIDADWLMEKRGITPEQVVDMLTLMGDKVDNIPGVEGVGPKTAAKLIQAYGSIDELLKHLDQIKGKRRENLEKAQAFLSTAKKLVTLDREVDIEFDLADAKVENIDVAGLHKVFKQLGFSRHSQDLDRLVKSSGSLKARAVVERTNDEFAGGLFGSIDQSVPVLHETHLATADGCDYRGVTTQAELDELVATLKKQSVLSVDCETIGLGHRTQLCGICLAWEENAGVYIPMRSPEPEKHLDAATVIGAIKPVLEDPVIGKTGHNLKYDFLVLRHAGIELKNIVFDSMVGGYLVGAPGQGMDHMAMSMLHRETIPISQLIGERGRGKTQKTMDQVPLAEIVPYAAEDADVSLRLYHLLKPQLETLGMGELAAKVEMPLVEVLAEMEDRGIKVDAGILDEQREGLQKRIDELRDQIHEAAGEAFNVDSPKQLAEILFTKLGLPVVKRTKTGPSTDIEVLEKLSGMDDLPAESLMVPRLVVEYRQLTKLVGTYLQNLVDAIEPETGRVHASFHQTGTATGRLSSSGPNLQNIPIRTDIGRQIRKAFVAEEGHLLVSADYSQIELRMLAHLSEDEALIEAFNRDQDIHTAVAAQVFGMDESEVTAEQRGHAKTINFGIVYGVTPYGLARRIENLNVEQAKTLIDDYRARFAGIDRFLQQCVAHAKEHGYVKTMLGRRREIEQINAKNGQVRALGERLAINTVVQGSAADLIKLAMVQLHRRIQSEGLAMDLLLQIHDELVVEVPREYADQAAEILREQMEGAMQLRVPLKVETGIGQDWYSAK